MMMIIKWMKRPSREDEKEEEEEDDDDDDDDDDDEGETGTTRSKIRKKVSALIRRALSRGLESPRLPKACFGSSRL